MNFLHCFETFDYKLSFFYSKSVSTLMKETGCRLEDPAASLFRESILIGDWDKVYADFSFSRIT